MRILQLMVLFLLLQLPLAASEDADRAELAAWVPQGSQILSIRVARPWAIVAYQVAGLEGGQTHLLRREKERWQHAFGGGGALGVKEIFAYGVPRSHWQRLLKWQIGADEVREALAQGPLWPQDSREELMPDQLQGCSPWELRLRLHELYARRGFQFKDPEMRRYFASRPWYRARRGLTEASLSTVERANSRILRRAGVELSTD